MQSLFRKEAFFKSLLVLMVLIMGLRATFFHNFNLALGLVVVAAVYAWRVYRKPVPLGWI